MFFPKFDYSGYGRLPEQFGVHSHVPDVHLRSVDDTIEVLSCLDGYGKCKLIDCYGGEVLDPMLERLCQVEKESVVCLVPDKLRKVLMHNKFNHSVNCAKSVVGFRADPLSKMLILTYEELHATLTANRRTLVDVFPNAIMACLDYRETGVHADIIAEILQSKQSEMRCLFHSRYDEFELRKNSSMCGSVWFRVLDVPTSSSSMASTLEDTLYSSGEKILLIMDEGPYKRSKVSSAARQAGYNWYEIPSDAHLQPEIHIKTLESASTTEPCVLCVPSVYRDGLGFKPTGVFDTSIVKVNGQRSRCATATELYIAYGRLGRNRGGSKVQCSYKRLGTEVRSEPTPEELLRQDNTRSYFLEEEDGSHDELSTLLVRSADIESLSDIPESRITELLGLKISVIKNRSGSHDTVLKSINDHNLNVRFVDEVLNELSIIRSGMDPKDALYPVLQELIALLHLQTHKLTVDASSLISRSEPLNVICEGSSLHYRTEAHKFEISENLEVLCIVNFSDSKRLIENIRAYMNKSDLPLLGLIPCALANSIRLHLHEWNPPD